MEQKHSFDVLTFTFKHIVKTSIKEANITARPILKVKNSAFDLFNAMIEYAQKNFSKKWLETDKCAKRFAFIVLMAPNPKKTKPTHVREYLQKHVNINSVFVLEVDDLLRTKQKTIIGIIEEATNAFLMLQEAFAIGEDMSCFFKEFETDKTWSNMLEHLNEKLVSVVYLSERSICDTSLGLWNKRVRDFKQSCVEWVVFSVMRRIIGDNDDQISELCSKGRTHLLNHVFSVASPTIIKELEESTQYYIITSSSKMKAQNFVQRLLSKENPIQPTGKFLAFLMKTNWDQSYLIDDLGAHCEHMIKCNLDKQLKSVCPENEDLCDD